MNKILTIVVPSYNTEKYIDECLPTLLDDRINEKVEIILVNDGSTDNTLSKLKEYEAKFPNTIKVVDKENGGHGSTINKGIEFATGKYFRVIDGDDWANTEELVYFVNSLEGKDEDLVLSPYEEHIFPERKINLIDFKLEENKVYDYDEMLALTGYVIPWMHATSFKTSILKTNNIKISEKMFYVDLQYIVFPMKYLKTVSLVNSKVYCYRLGTHEQSVNPKNYLKNREMHRKVIYSIVEEYKSLVTEFGECHRVRTVRERLLSEVALDTTICLLVDNIDEAISEFKNYKNNILKLDPYFWNENPNKKIKLLSSENRLMFAVLAKYTKFKLLK